MSGPDRPLGMTSETMMRVGAGLRSRGFLASPWCGVVMGSPSGVVALATQATSGEGAGPGSVQAVEGGFWLQAFQQRPELRWGALVSLPETAALAAAGRSPAACLLPLALEQLAELFNGLGAPLDPEALLVAALVRVDAVVVERFGVIVVAASGAQLAERIEAIEHAAIVTRRLAKEPVLTATTIARLGAAVGALPGALPCAHCRECSHGTGGRQSADPLAAEISAAIAAHLRR